MSAALKRLGPGQLDGLVLGYLRKHKGDGPLTATTVAKGLGGRSAGAVSNCLSRLVTDGKVRQAKKTPRAYVLAARRGERAGPTGDVAGAAYGWFPGWPCLRTGSLPRG